MPPLWEILDLPLPSIPLRMEIAPRHVPSPRKYVGSPQGGQVCITRQCPNINIQLIFPRYLHISNRCTYTVLVREEQLHQPPFFLLPRILGKIRTDQAEATLIAPLWKAQTWYPQLVNMLKCPPVRIPNNDQCIITQIAKPEARKNPAWKIYAWRTSGEVGSDSKIGKTR